ncbi:MAG: hypothetical protein ACJA1C_000091 [Crocinitomicaceae bacterium]|jgi:hypothetical protein
MKRLFLLSLIIGTLFTGCTKKSKVVDYKVVMTSEDRSISTSDDIVDFSFVDENIGYALGYDGYSVKLHKTINGGLNWIEVGAPNPSFNIDYDDIHSMLFVDEFNGMLLINQRLYRTLNGGMSWIELTNQFGFALDVIFSCQGEDGNIYAFETNNSNGVCEIYKLEMNGYGYTIVATYPTLFTDFDTGHYHDNHVVLLSRNFNLFEHMVYRINLNNFSGEILEVTGSNYEIPNDAMHTSQGTIFARKSGLVHFFNKQAYFYNNNDYYSIDQVNDYFVAVRDNSISTNYIGTWEEALNVEGTSFIEKFRRVRKIDDSHFYLSGTNGLFYKSTFE